MGDPAGISPELLAKLLSQKELLSLAAVTVIGDRRVLALGEQAAGREPRHRDRSARWTRRRRSRRARSSSTSGTSIPPPSRWQQATAQGGKFAMRNFAEALTAAKAHRFDGIMFTPFNKLALKRAGNPYPDEIRWASDLLGWNGACSEYNKLDELWNARVTSHEPLRDVADMLTRERIVAAIEATDSTLRRAGLERPRIAVAGLNPHAGEGGVFGREEIDVIAPAVESRGEARLRGRKVRSRPTRSGCARGRGDYDVVLSMYHDQGQIALKLLGFERGVTILGGLPIPIATPAHGTAYDIQGKGIADPSATIQAFRTLVMLATRAARQGGRVADCAVLHRRNAGQRAIGRRINAPARRRAVPRDAAAGDFEPIHPHRIVVEQHALLVFRHVGDDRLEAGEDGIEAADQSVDREIAREHAAVRAEDADRIAHDRGIASGAPAFAADPEA
jgi:4-hydroxythreonine-4-phosphate dehydrogenase